MYRNNIHTSIEIPSELINILCIEPKRGIVMQNEVKNCKVWVTAGEREKVLGMSFVGKCLRVNMTMKAEYNRKMLEKLNLPGWEKAKKSFSSVQIPIVISHQASELRSELKNSAGNSLQKISSSRQLAESDNYNNFRGNGNGNEFKVGQSYSQYQNRNNRYDNRMSKVNNKKIGEKLDRELDFLFENQVSRQAQKIQNERERPGSGLQYGAGQTVHYSNNINPYASRKLNYNEGQLISYQPRNPLHPNSKKIPPSLPSSGQIVNYMPTPGQAQALAQSQGYGQRNSYPSPFSQPETRTEINKEANNQRFLEVLMLAALAGFFAALGSNFKHLFG